MLDTILARLGFHKPAVTDDGFERRLTTLGRRVPAALPAAGRSAFKYQY